MTVNIFFAAVIMLWATLGRAQVAVEDRKDLVVDQMQFRDVAGDLRCPTCTGLSVLDSDATFSVQIKNEVKEQLAAGKSRDEILKFFVTRYGPWILRAPPAEGVNALAWVVPISALIVGPIAIWFVLGRRRRVRDVHFGRSTEVIVEELKRRLQEARAKGGA